MTVRDAKTMLFKILWEPLNFVILVILAKFLIPEFGSYRVRKSVETKFLDEINLKMIKDNRWTSRDAKTM